MELLIRGLAQKGHPVSLITRPGSPLGQKLEEADIELFYVRPRFEFDPLAVFEIASWIRKKRPAVVGMHASHSHTLGILAKKLISHPPKFVVHRRVDFTPGTDVINRWKYQKAPDGFIAISQAVKGALLKAGVPDEKIQVVHSGVPPVIAPQGAADQIRRELCIDAGRKIVTDVAGLVDHKGHKYLIDAIPAVLEKSPDALFLLVGDGALRNNLEEQARGLALSPEHIRFLGHRKDVEKILAASCLFVMTSQQEGLCTSIIDAQLAGVPVVGTDAGGIGELVIDGETGLLAKSKSPESISEKIITLLNDGDKSEQLAARAKKRALAGFTDAAMVAGTLLAYQRLISQEPS